MSQLVFDEPTGKQLEALYQIGDAVCRREVASVALAAGHRVVRPGGRVLVWDTDWATVSWHSGDPYRMQRFLAAWDEHLAHPSLPRTLAPAMRSAGLDRIHAIAHTFAATAWDLDTFGVSLIPLIADFAPGRNGLREA